MFQINQIINLRAENRVKIYEQALVPGNRNAHTWNVSVLDGTDAASLEGTTATLYITRADGKTVAVTGERITISGNTASAVLPEDAYAVEGAVLLEMEIYKGKDIITCAQLGAGVKKRRTDDIVLPGQGEIIDLNSLLKEIAQMREASASAREAASAANQAASAANAQAQNAGKIAGKLQGLSTTAQSLPYTSAATASVTEDGTKYIIDLGIPRGTPGAVVSETEPDDPQIGVWINPNGGADGVGTGVFLDPTLTASDKAAPADAVGSLRDEIDALHPLTIASFTVTPGMAEKGSTVTSESFAFSVNRLGVALTLEGDAVTGSSATREDALTADKTYTLRAVLNGAEKTATAAIRFVAPVYYGVGSDYALADGTVLALTRVLTTSRARTFTVNAGEGQYILYALPEALGVPVFKVGGFEGGFALVGVFDFTNASGHTESYRLYRSVNAGLGNTTVAVS